MSRRVYSDREKGEALCLLAATGNVKGTARTLGLPRKTLESWSRGVGVNEEVRRMSGTVEIRGALAQKFKTLAHESLAAITPEKLANASLKDLALAAAIFTDKSLLLQSNPAEEFEARMREHFNAVAARLYEIALERGHAETTLSQVKQRMAEKYPHTKVYLLTEGEGAVN